MEWDWGYYHHFIITFFWFSLLRGLSLSLLRESQVLFLTRLFSRERKLSFFSWESWLSFFLKRVEFFCLERLTFFFRSRWFRFFLMRDFFFLGGTRLKESLTSSHAGQARVLHTHLVKASVIAMSQPKNRQGKWIHAVVGLLEQKRNSL